MTVNNPGGLARNRLENKMPPKKAKIRQKAAPRRARVTRAVMACMDCDADERTTEIKGGMCPDCRAEFGEVPKGTSPRGRCAGAGGWLEGPR
ncbi:hypothetical protein [Streptomyces sp. MH13]|uniref:hypothetical protein n=1 Tax=Streptomyces sp. MH13 TaxID=3417651 RepID=UPI003CF474D8